MLSSLNHIASLHIAHRTSKIYISICLVKRMFLQLRNGFYLSLTHSRKLPFFVCLPFKCKEMESLCVHASIEFHLFSPPAVILKIRSNLIFLFISFVSEQTWNASIVTLSSSSDAQLCKNTQKASIFLSLYELPNFPTHNYSSRHRLLLKISFCGKIFI